MKQLKFKTITKQQLADTVTPVGMYSKIRDKYANSLLLESSDYHSKEESYTFICIEPIVTLKADENKFYYSYKNNVIDVCISFNRLKLGVDKYSLGFEINNFNCFIGSGHFVATYKKEVFDEIYSFIGGKKLAGIGEQYIDQKGLEKDFWRRFYFEQ